MSLTRQNVFRIWSLPTVGPMAKERLLNSLWILWSSLVSNALGNVAKNGTFFNCCLTNSVSYLLQWQFQIFDVVIESILITCQKIYSYFSMYVQLSSSPTIYCSWENPVAFSPLMMKSAEALLVFWVQSCSFFSTGSNWNSDRDSKIFQVLSRKAWCVFWSHVDEKGSPKQLELNSWFGRSLQICISITCLCSQYCISIKPTSCHP